MATVLWLLKEDILFEFVAAIIALIIGVYGIRISRYAKRRKMLFLGAGFILFSLGLYARVGFDMLIEVELLNRLDFLLGHHHMLLTAKALLVLYMFLTYSGYLTILLSFFGERDVYIPVLMMLFAVLATLTSGNMYIAFHIISLILIGLIILHLWKNYKKSHGTNPCIVLLSFVSLLLAQLCFILVWFSIVFYYIANMFVLLGYLLLLSMLIRVLK